MQQRNMRPWIVLILVSVWCMYGPIVGAAKDPSPRIRHETHKPFPAFTEALLMAIRQHNMGLICRANAQAGAASRGVKIHGNQVFMIYRPDFAIRMLEADVEAGFEAPLRIYVVEKPDGTAEVSYIKPSAVFAGYDNPQLNKMAQELDTIFAAIIRESMQQ